MIEVRCKAPELPSRRMLIVAKTYPELSSKYGETVCTAAVDEDGNPLRLYPIPFRYLAGSQKFARYQWISAPIQKSPRDVRPESYTVDSERIVLQESVPPTPDEWGRRAACVFKHAPWQYSSMTSLFADQEAEGRSLAVIYPREITSVTLRKRSTDDEVSFEQKLKTLRAKNAAARNQLDLFESTIPPQMKTLEYMGERVCVDWQCSDDSCKGHSMQVLDWEICELARKRSLEDARKKVETLLDLDRYKTALILGNFHMYPGSFAIIGLWYPTRNTGLF